MDLSRKQLDEGAFTVLMQRFTEYRLPRARRLLYRVNQGEKLSDYDILWLKHVYADSRGIEYMIERNPEYTRVFVRSIALYAEITAKALENEKAGP